MSEFTIYHNPKCSKSRATLALLREHGIEPRIVEYLKDPPTRAQLRSIVAMLGIAPEQLVRKGEDIYKSAYAARTLSDSQWIDAMIGAPILMERPIVVSGERAVLGRPPENVLQLLGIPVPGRESGVSMNTGGVGAPKAEIPDSRPGTGIRRGQ